MAEQEWWQEYFDDEYLRLYEPFLAPERTAREARAIHYMLDLEEGARILDLCCGQGRHAVLLAQRGYQVTGLDLSETLLRAAREQATAAGVELALVRGDMRHLPWENAFDACINMYTAFGYFRDEGENQRVLHEVYRVLRPGGKFLMELSSRDHNLQMYSPRTWYTLDDGTPVWVERDFDPITGLYSETLRWLEEGHVRTRKHSLRLYTATEITAMLREAGLEPVEYYGDFDMTPLTWFSRRLIVVSQKPNS